MIKRLRIQNYKALRDVALELTPIHVLIGPNDSGKTSILEAIAALCRSVDCELDQAFAGSWKGSELVWKGMLDLPITLTADVDQNGDSFEYSLSCKLHNPHQLKIQEERVKSRSSVIDLEKLGGLLSAVYRLTKDQNVSEDRARASDAQLTAAKLVLDALNGVHFFRMIPEYAAMPVVVDDSSSFRMEQSGFGLASCLNDIKEKHQAQFILLKERFMTIFPRIKWIDLKPEPAFQTPSVDPQTLRGKTKADGKGIYFGLAEGGREISASQASDGMLLVLAYLTIRYHPQPPRVLLVEEPENGVHPKRLQDVLGILRELVEEHPRTQVILTTHSPYVVDLFEPKEVTLCQMEEDGSVSTRRLSESETVRKQLDIFTLGEIWSAEGDETLAQTSLPAEGAEQ